MALQSFPVFAALVFISVQHSAISFPPPPGFGTPPPPDTEPAEEKATDPTHPFPSDPPTGQLAPTSAEAALLAVGFHALLGDDQYLEQGETRKLERYTKAKIGIFQIGDDYPFKIMSGIFTANQRGIYQFTAIVHFTDTSNERNNSSANEMVDRHVTVSLCIQGDCENNVVLRNTAGITSRRFSVLVTGTMALGVEQSVSVFVTNHSGRVLVAKALSSFMGHIVGST